MVFAVNSLLYLNQSVPPYGVSLNSQTNGTTAFPLRKLCDLRTHTCTGVFVLYKPSDVFCSPRDVFGLPRCAG